MRKSRTIGRRKVVSVKDDARRRAARNFLLGIKLNGESMLASITPAAMLEPLDSPVAQPNITLLSELTTPRLHHHSSVRSGRDDAPVLRHGSLRKHGASGHMQPALTTQLPNAARSPFKVSMSLERYDSTDYRLESPVKAEERKRLLRGASLSAHFLAVDAFLTTGQR